MDDKKEQQSPQTNVNIAMIFALVALCLMVLYKVLVMCGVWSGVVFAIMGIVVYGLTITGAVLGYLKDKKLTIAVLLNVALFFASLLIF